MFIQSIQSRLSVAVATISLWGSLWGLVFLTACNSSEQTVPFTRPPLQTRLDNDAAQAEINRLSQSVVLDPSLSADELGALAYDFTRIEALSYRSFSRSNLAAIDRAGLKLFGNQDDANATQNFLFSRIKQFAGSSTNPDADPRIIATNLSASLWLAALNKLKDPRDPPRISSGTRDFEAPNLNSIGLIVFGKQYGFRDDSIYRIATLVHEARHSDCPNGLTIDQVLRIQEQGGPDAPREQLDPELRDAIAKCGFMHEACPAGHELAGLLACETGKGWGAYSTELAFFSKVVKTCANCSESEVPQAIGGLTEISGRVTHLDDLLSGNLGAPEMGEVGVTE